MLSSPRPCQHHPPRLCRSHLLLQQRLLLLLRPQVLAQQLQLLRGQLLVAGGRGLGSRAKWVGQGG